MVKRCAQLGCWLSIVHVDCVCNKNKPPVDSCKFCQLCMQAVWRAASPHIWKSSLGLPNKQAVADMYYS